MFGNAPPDVKYNYSGTGERDVAGVISTELTNAAGFACSEISASRPAP